MKIAFIFPGQGSQKVGMVHDLYEKDTVVTFGRQEMEDMLFDAGFATTH